MYKPFDSTCSDRRCRRSAATTDRPADWPKSFNTPPAARFKHCEDAYFLPCYTQNVKKVGRFKRRP